MKKTIFITGSTDGIGKLAAIKLAKDGHEILLHGRNMEKLTATISKLKALSKNENVKAYAADLSDLDSVKGLGKKISEEVPQIDVLINNAGVYNSPIAKNKAGLDMRYVVNYFAPYLLTNALIPLMSSSSDARIINLSSAAQSPIQHEVLSGNAPSSAGESYAQSKLALTMWSFYLADQQNDIAVIAVNPGSLQNTNMVREAFGRSWSSPDKGANILYDLALSEEYKGISGKYFDNDQGGFGRALPEAYNKAAINKLIEATKNVLNKERR